MYFFRILAPVPSSSSSPAYTSLSSSLSLELSSLSLSDPSSSSSSSLDFFFLAGFFTNTFFYFLFLLFSVLGRRGLEFRLHVTVALVTMVLVTVILVPVIQEFIQRFVCQLLSWIYFQLFFGFSTISIQYFWPIFTEKQQKKLLNIKNIILLGQINCI